MAQEQNNKLRKISFNLSEAVYEEVKCLANRAGITVTELIRRGVSLEKLAIEARAKESRLVILNTNDGSMRELVLL